MANKPSRPAPRAGDRNAAPAAPKPRLLWLWVALGAVVVLLGGFAILSSGDDEELTVGSVPTTAAGGSDATDASDPTGASDSTGGSGTTAAAGGEVAEAWPVTVTGTALAELPREGADPALGAVAPTISGYSFDGTPVEVDPSKGPVMLVFLAHWCPHCNREIPELNAWRDAGGVPEGLQVIGVATGTDPKAENYPPSEWLPGMDWSWPVIADSPEYDAARAFGLSGFPFTAIVGTDGTVLSRWSGEVGLDGITERVAAALG